MVPVSHLLWSHVWLGVATDAFDRARAFVRASAKQTGETPPTARKLSALMTDLTLLRAEVGSALRYYETGDLGTMASAVRFNNLKIAASEAAPRICLGALNVCGIVGYKNDTPFSVGRQLRDSLSAALMVANDRIHETNAGLLLIAKDV
jgi:acyl-CoA dehydrogenase